MSAILKETTVARQETGAVDMPEIERTKKFIGFDAGDEALLRELRPVVAEHAAEIVGVFYKNIERYPELLAVIERADSNTDRLSTAQERYLLELFDGDYGPSYVERRLRIGVIHNRIGLTPRWYLGSYSVYMALLLPLIQKKFRFQPAKAVRAVSAVNKILAFDAQLAIDTYIEAVMGDLRNVSLTKEDIERTVAEYRDYVDEVAKGDLSRTMQVAGDGDLGRLGTRLNAMTEGLATMARQTHKVSDELGETVSDMLGAVNAQASAASQQAAAVGQASSSLEEIRAMSEQSQEKASALGDSADRTRAEAERGLTLVDQTVTGMESIRDKVEGIATSILALSEQTQQVSEITSTVNNLAHQLKMLALNASIEAAKAGEAGKGFAVVATEVKELAEQSKQATDQVHLILQEIRRATDKAVMVTEEGTKGVDSGMELVKQAGSAVRQLAGVIQETATASQQIVASVRQEAVGIDQVANAMGEINASTSQFVDTTRQTKAATERLSAMAEQMRATNAVFKFSQDDTPAER